MSRCRGSIRWDGAKFGTLSWKLKNQGRTIFFSTHILSDAEMLCDRVAVLVGGKLQGVGAPREIVSMEVRGMEILFELRGGSVLPPKMLEQATHTGDRYRIVVPEAAGISGAGTIERLRGANFVGDSAAAIAGRLFLEVGGGAEESGAGERSSASRGGAMSTIPGIVAVNTFREAVRDRVLYNLIFFALLMMGTAVLVGGVSIGIERDVIVNLGLDGHFSFWNRDGDFYRRGAGA